MKNIRLSKASEAALLPDIERSAAKAFLKIPELAWIADDVVQTTEQHLEFIAKKTSWVLVDQQDQPLGFLTAEVQENALHILEISVQHEWQGYGLGRALIQHAINEAKKHHLELVTLTTFRELAWNEAFYKSIGFETLDTDQVGLRLSNILDEEVAHGLLAEQRCAMQLILK